MRKRNVHACAGLAGGSAASPRRLAFPIYNFVVEHPDGAFAIDAGLGNGVVVPRWQRRVVPTVIDGPRPLDEAMHARGLDPGAVTRVVLTHLDWDHVGGIGYFPKAEILIHRPEYDAATARTGSIRYKPDLWQRRSRPRCTTSMTTRTDRFRRASRHPWTT